MQPTQFARHIDKVLTFLIINWLWLKSCRGGQARKKLNL